MLYLNRDELAQLVGCLPTSKACMRRWLERNGWPFEPDRNGFPKVSRAYYDSRMMGATPAANECQAPDFSAFLKVAS